jgi:hypothetical protein
MSKTPVEIDAVLNDGTWGTVINWLDKTGLGRVPFGQGPPVTRNQDGSLNVCSPVGDTLTYGRAQVGEYVVLYDDGTLGVRGTEAVAA